MKSTTKRSASALVLAAATTLAGCSAKPQDQLQGSWVGHSVQTTSPIDREDANAWVRETSFQFTENAVSVAIPEGTRSGTFTVVKSEGERLTLDIRDAENKAFPTELRVKNDKELHWKVDPNTVVVLQRRTASSRN